MFPTAKAKFDETIRAAVKLGVDSRHADQQVRGAIVLPTAPASRFALLYSLRAQRLTRLWLQAQTSLVQRDLMERIQKENFFEFDVVIATPDMMGVVGRLGRDAWS